MPTYKDETTGKWYCQFYYADWTGKRKHKVKRGFEKRRDAEQWEHEFLSKKQGEKATVATVAKAFANYSEKRMQLQHIKESTYEQKMRNLRLYILPYFEDVTIDSIRQMDLTCWVYELSQKKTPKGNPLKNSTINNAIALFREVFAFAKRNFGLRENPAEDVEKLKVQSEPVLKIWTKEQFDIFYANLDRELHRTLFNLLWWSGLRVGEALALLKTDIHDDYISVTKTFRRVHGVDRFTTPKTKSSVRKVKVPPFIITQLQNYIARLYSFKDNDRIFPLTISSASSVLYYHEKKLGLPTISLHCLRHSYASMLLHATGDVTVVASQLGHANPEITLRVYSHMLPDADTQSMCKLEQYVASQQDKYLGKTIDVEAGN